MSRRDDLKYQLTSVNSKALARKRLPQPKNLMQFKPVYSDKFNYISIGDDLSGRNFLPILKPNYRSSAHLTSEDPVSDCAKVLCHKASDGSFKKTLKSRDTPTDFLNRMGLEETLQKIRQRRTAFNSNYNRLFKADSSLGCVNELSNVRSQLAGIKAPKNGVEQKIYLMSIKQIFTDAGSSFQHDSIPKPRNYSSKTPEPYRGGF